MLLSSQSHLHVHTKEQLGIVGASRLTKTSLTQIEASRSSIAFTVDWRGRDCRFLAAHRKSSTAIGRWCAETSLKTKIPVSIFHLVDPPCTCLKVYSRHFRRLAPRIG